MTHALGAVTLLFKWRGFWQILFLQNNILCILHLLSMLLTSSALVIPPLPPREIFKTIGGKSVHMFSLFAVNISFSELIIYMWFQALVLRHSKGITWYRHNVMVTKCLVLQRRNIFTRFTTLCGRLSTTTPKVTGKTGRMWPSTPHNPHPQPWI